VSAPADSRVVHANPHFDVRYSDFSRVGGPRSYWHATKPDFAAVAVWKDGALAMVRARRPLIDMEVLELPQGALEAGESARDAAVREVHEETGLSVSDVRALGVVHESYGMTAARCFAFEATAGHGSEASPDADEGIVGLEFLTGEALAAEIRRGTITDSVTLAVLGLLATRRCPS
jgi:ADP-ribose pyrophosphatase